MHSLTILVDRRYACLISDPIVFINDGRITENRVNGFIWFNRLFDKKVYRPVI